jgi:hypothetical protein
METLRKIASFSEVLPIEIPHEERKKNKLFITFRYISIFLIILSLISYVLMLFFSKQYGTTGTTGTLGPFLSTLIWILIVGFLVVLTTIILNLEYFSLTYSLFVEGLNYIDVKEDYLNTLYNVRVTNIIFTSLLILSDIGIFSYFFFFFRKEFNDIFLIIITSLVIFNLISHVLFLITTSMILKIIKNFL